MSKSGLDKLIEQVIAEKYYLSRKSKDKLKTADTNQLRTTTGDSTAVPYPHDKTKVGYGSLTIAELGKIAGFEIPDSIVSKEDMDYLFNNPEKLDRFNLIVLNKIKNAAPTNLSKVPLAYRAGVGEFVEDAIKVLDNYEKSKAYKGPTSIVMPSLTSAGGDTGVFSDSQMKIFSSFFDSGSTFQERMLKLSNFSKKIYEVASTGTDQALASDPKELLISIMVLDSLNFIVKDFESGSSAYLFEAFLALMGGGKILGKEKTAAGKMGGADFDYQMGGQTYLGSSKYYGKGSTLEQAKDGFDVGKPVLYIVALKKEDSAAKGTTAGGTSDPTKIVKLAIYTFSIVKNTDDTFNFADKAGITYLQNIATESDGKIKIGGTARGLKPDNLLGDIYFATHNTKGLKDMLKEGMASQEISLKEAYTAFENFFTSINKSKDGAQKYLAVDPQESGASDVGLESIREIDNSQDHLITLMNSLKNVTKFEFSGEKGSRSVKSLPESLDGLIESIIKKKLLK